VWSVQVDGEKVAVDGGAEGVADERGAFGELPPDAPVLPLLQAENKATMTSRMISSARTEWRLAHMSCVLSAMSNQGTITQSLSV